MLHNTRNLFASVKFRKLSAFCFKVKCVSKVDRSKLKVAARQVQLITPLHTACPCQCDIQLRHLHIFVVIDCCIGLLKHRSYLLNLSWISIETYSSVEKEGIAQI